MNFTLKGVTSPLFVGFPPIYLSLLPSKSNSPGADRQDSLPLTILLHERGGAIPPFADASTTALPRTGNCGVSCFLYSEEPKLFYTSLWFSLNWPSFPPPRFPGLEPSPQTGTRARGCPHAPAVLAPSLIPKEGIVQDWPAPSYLLQGVG